MPTPLSDPDLFLKVLSFRNRVIEWATAPIALCQLAQRQRAMQAQGTPLAQHQRRQWLKVQSDFYDRRQAT